MANTFNYTGYKLVFDDEFNSLSLDMTGQGTATWAPYYVAWNNRTLADNGEQQMYMDANYRGTSDRPLGVDPFRIVDGVLNIEAKPTPEAVKPHVWNMPYTSGHISSELSFTQQYGYFEMKAKMPVGQGLWPCFWLLPADGGWPPEIDIFENLGKEGEKYTVHQSTHGTGQDTKAVPLSSDVTNWHTYGLEWTKDTIAWYVDGVETNRVANHFHQPMYIVADLAVGGNWPGNPDATTPFPAKLQIDYIRAYSADPDVKALPTPPANTPPMTPPVGNLPVTGKPVAWKTGTAGNDALTGSDRNDFLNGTSGADILTGGKGDDTYIVDRATDSVVEKTGEGIDQINSWSTSCQLPAHVENLKLEGSYASTGIGNAGNNILTGSIANNDLRGGAGNDILIGGKGADILTGGTGKDTFVYRALAEKGDVITDFQLGEDGIDIHQLMAALNHTGTPVADHYLSLQGTADGSTAVMIDPDGSGAALAQQLALLDHVGVQDAQASVMFHVDAA